MIRHLLSIEFASYQRCRARRGHRRRREGRLRAGRLAHHRVEEGRLRFEFPRPLRRSGKRQSHRLQQQRPQSNHR